MANLINKTIGNRYKVEEFLGRGGMAEVYKVRDTLRSVNLAMKVLFPDLAEDPAFVRRFRREAKNLAALQHPNIVRFYEMEEDDLLVFLTMDYIEGSTLRAEIKFSQGRPLANSRILEVMESVCGALNYAHHMGVVHCDVKPANIMIHKNGTVLVADFGIAHQAEGATTATMVGAGTPAYMAPEQIHEEDPIPQTDIYALGIVLYEMLTGGERPFMGDQTTITGSTGEKVRWEQVNLKPLSPKRFNPRMSEELEEVVLKCLEKDPRQRYGGVQELLSALEDSLGMEKHEEEPVKSVAEKMELPVLIEGKEPWKPMEKEKPRQIITGKEIVEKRQGRLRWVGLGLGGLLIVLLGLIVGNRIGKNVLFAPPAAPAAPAAEGTQVREKDGMEMVNVPAGPFTMGSNKGDKDEKLERRETLPGFWIDRTEVTNGMYEKCEQVGECQPPKELSSYTRERYYGTTEFADYPVIHVDWNMAKRYCEWAGSSLPTEEQWEKAAQGTDGRTYPWGNGSPDSGLANYNGNEGDTTEVGIYEEGASPYGALDIAGNVWEWTADWYDVYPGGDSQASSGFGTTYRVLRGGSWYDDADGIRSAYRGWGLPSGSNVSRGFRCALSRP